jgi:hypothetical protein
LLNIREDRGITEEEAGLNIRQDREILQKKRQG